MKSQPHSSLLSLPSPPLQLSSTTAGRQGGVWGWLEGDRSTALHAPTCEATCIRVVQSAGAPGQRASPCRPTWVGHERPLAVGHQLLHREAAPAHLGLVLEARVLLGGCRGKGGGLELASSSAQCAAV